MMLTWFTPKWFLGKFLGCSTSNLRAFLGKRIGGRIVAGGESGSPVLQKDFDVMLFILGPLLAGSIMVLL